MIPGTQEGKAQHLLLNWTFKSGHAAQPALASSCHVQARLSYQVFWKTKRRAEQVGRSWAVTYSTAAVAVTHGSEVQCYCGYLSMQFHSSHPETSPVGFAVILHHLDFIGKKTVTLWLGDQPKAHIRWQPQGPENRMSGLEIRHPLCFLPIGRVSENAFRPFFLHEMLFLFCCS